MKLHLRKYSLGGRLYNIIMLRPGLKVCWSSNYFHETWHILGNMKSAKLFAHLMWGLSYQKKEKERTFVFIDPSYIRPNPFDGEKSDPIVIGFVKPPKALLKKLKKPKGKSLGVE